MKRQGGGYKGSRPNKKTADNRPSWVKNQREERHPGSFPLEELKASEAFQRHIIQQNGVKRKYAVCISYIGTKYQGLQINPGAKTIEGELERAFFLAGGIVESNYGFMQKVQWTRAARTDRGVHAITQCCAMKLLFAENARERFIAEANSFLPEDIRIQAMTKVTKAFNSKAQCTRREYLYMLPSFALMPVAEANALLAEAFTRQGPVVGAGYEGGFVDPHSAKTLGRVHIESVRAQFAAYRATPAQVTALGEALALYEGTRSYHNFTTGKDSSEANSKRFVSKFSCSTPFVVDATGVEWLRLSVLGQSFLFNQIRKMVAFAVDIARGVTSTAALETAFLPARLDIPLAPAMGLFLNDIFFDGYNSKQRRQAEIDQRVAEKDAPKSADGAAEDQTPVAASEDAADVAVSEVVADVASEVAEGGPASEADPVQPNALATSGGDGEGDDDQLKREELDWYGDVETKARLDAFRDNELLPHIYREEATSLGFIYYLDYCRAYPHPYRPRKAVDPSPTPVPDAEAADGNESS